MCIYHDSCTGSDKTDITSSTVNPIRFMFLTAPVRVSNYLNYCDQWRDNVKRWQGWWTKPQVRWLWMDMSKVLIHISHQWNLQTVSKSAYKLLNLRAIKQTAVNKIYNFQCMGKIFVLKFKWHSHALKTIWFICNMEISRALRFKTSYTFWIPNIQQGNKNEFARWFHQSTLEKDCMQI